MMCLKASASHTGHGTDSRDKTPRLTSTLAGAQTLKLNLLDEFIRSWRNIAIALITPAQTPTANKGSVRLIANDETMKRTMPSAGLIAVCSTCPSQSLTTPKVCPAFTCSFTAIAGYQNPSCSLRNQRN